MDNPYIKVQRIGRVGVITLDRPDRLNAWDQPMRTAIVAALRLFDTEIDIGAVIMTGAGERAFSAGQDFNEAHEFDEEQAEIWMREWESFYDTVRSLTKPVVVALNGTAAGSAFQVALLGDIRVGHAEVKMGQPEINSGIASIGGPWIMREMLGMSRTIELTLTGRMMGAEECARHGLIHHLVPRGEVMSKALEVANELAGKAPLAMRLDRAWLRDMTEAGFRQAMNAGIVAHREAFKSGEPARQMEAFMQRRGRTLGQ